MEEHAIILLTALIIDWMIGDPEWLWKKLPHPVALFGSAVGWLDKRLNIKSDAPHNAVRKGAISITLLILMALFVAKGLDWLLSLHLVVGWIGELVIVQTFLAQKSLFDHVRNVADGLDRSGLEGGRKAVGMIIGRDPEMLNESGVCRAAIESLAENFGDGVVAPAFWYLVFGLPGLLVYKMINTADSMIAYRNDKYLHFGRATAQIDDLANWLPARLSMIFIAIGALFRVGVSSARNVIETTLRDAGLHRSPNAGWPEAAMAGACNFALGGPRVYSGETVSQAFINGAGKMQLQANDVRAALGVFSYACFSLWGGVVLFFVLS